MYRVIREIDFWKKDRAKLREGKKVNHRPSFGVWATECPYHHQGRAPLYQRPPANGDQITHKLKNKARDLNYKL